MPFSLTETLSDAAPANPAAEKRLGRQMQAEQLVFGCYPAVFLTPRPKEKVALLNDLVEALILRDASDLFRIKRIDGFRKLLSLQSAVKQWRSKAGAEVDFIVDHAGKVFALEVKYAALKQPKLARSARSFIDAYHPTLLVVVNMALEDTITVEDTPVHFITPCSLIHSQLTNLTGNHKVRHNDKQNVRKLEMLAKITAKNQITIPKKIVEQLPDVEYFDVELKDGIVLLKPLKVYGTDLGQIRSKLKALGLNADIVKEAVRWARKR